MADPDAPKRGNEVAGPWLHWIQAGFKENDIGSGTTLGILFLYFYEKPFSTEFCIL
jgi:hypothetical protein